MSPVVLRINSSGFSVVVADDAAAMTKGKLGGCYSGELSLCPVHADLCMMLAPNCAQLTALNEPAWPGTD